MEKPEAACLRTENAPTISDRDFSEISERVETSVCRSLKENETNQREILKMIENRSSKIDFLSGKNPDNLDTGASEFQFENTASTSRNCEAESLTQSEGLHLFIFSYFESRDEDNKTSIISDQILETDEY